jgi:hypothetical protein
MALKVVYLTALVAHKMRPAYDIVVFIVFIVFNIFQP